MSSSDDDKPVPKAAADRRRRRGTKAAKRQREHDRDIFRSPSYSPLMRSYQNLSDTDEDYYHRSPSPSPARRRAHTRRYFDLDRRSRSPRRRRRARSNTYSDDSDEDEPDRRSRSRSPRRLRRPRSYTYSDDDEDEPDRRSPRRRRRARSNSYSDEDDADETDRRNRSPSPMYRGRARSNGSYSDDEEEEAEDRRSRSPSRRAAPRSCRSQSRSRSEECEDRRCCPPRPEDDDGDFYVRIDRTDDHLFKCARCQQLLPPPVVYECIEGHVTCASCHGSTNGGERRCSQCGSSRYSPSPAVAKWLSSLRFPCRNHDHGCPSFLPRHEMEVSHEPTCVYAPVFCPVRRCGFDGGTADSLERHLAVRHGWSVDAFRYGEPVTVRVHPDPEPRSVLRAAEDGELFYLRAVPERGGAALSMIRIRPDNAAAAAEEAEFEYEVRTHAAAGTKHRLQMQSTVWATSLGNGGAADENPVSVRVHFDMLPVDGPERDSVEVRVRKVAPAAAARDN